MTCRAWIFDLDGVLTETSEQHFLAWKELAAEIGIAIDRRVNEGLKGVSRRESLERILAHGGQLGHHTEEELAGLMERKNRRYLELVSEFTPANLMPGALDLLEGLRARGLGIGLASASRNAPMLLEKLGIAGYFGSVADPTRVPGKPAPDLFLMAAEGLGVPARACVGVEDSEAGIEAINASGMVSVGIGGGLSRARIIWSRLDLVDPVRCEGLISTKGRSQ